MGKLATFMGNPQKIYLVSFKCAESIQTQFDAHFVLYHPPLIHKTNNQEQLFTLTKD